MVCRLRFSTAGSQPVRTWTRDARPTPNGGASDARDVHLYSRSRPEPYNLQNPTGEYAMLKAAAQNGWLNERDAVLEALLSMRRAGADLILTYYAMDAARWLSE